MQNQLLFDSQMKTALNALLLFYYSPTIQKVVVAKYGTHANMTSKLSIQPRNLW